MWLLIIILNNEEYLDDIIQSLVELGTLEGVVFEGESLTQKLAKEVPIFAGIRMWLMEKKEKAKIIIGIVEEREAGKKLIEMLKEIEIDITKPGVAKIITIKVDSLFGSSI